VAAAEVAGVDAVVVDVVGVVDAIATGGIGRIGSAAVVNDPRIRLVPSSAFRA
jgi:hypothetical protein